MYFYWTTHAAALAMAQCGWLTDAGDLEDAQLPSKKTFLPKTISFFDTQREIFESYLQVSAHCVTWNGKRLECRRFLRLMIQITDWIQLVSVMVRHQPLCQYSPDHRVPCYAELAVSSPAVAETVASTHCTYPRRDGQAEWPEWLGR